MKHCIAFAAALMCMTAPQAHGQIWIGQVAADMMSNRDEPPALDLRCMTGRSTASDRHVRRTRDHVAEIMERYIAHVRTAEVVDVSAHFGPNAKEGVWSFNGAATTLTNVADTLSLTHRAELGPPDAFIASGDGSGATAVWVVRDASGQVAGHYRGLFRRVANRWSISQLYIVEGPAEPASLAPFCTRPGDIEQFLSMHDEDGRARWDDIEKSEEELEAAQLP